MPKLPKCTIGKTHKWQWVKNVTEVSESPSKASFRLKGVFKCECGQKKLGEPQ